MQTALSPTGRIRVSGADAETFLQGQLTQDLRIVGPEPRFAGYCSPKGRLLAVMKLSRADQDFDLELHAGVLPATLKRLRMFVLRSKVTLDEIPALPGADVSAWQRQGILQGVPVVYPETSDHFVPQMVNLDRLGGIGFNKGCYTGQEIVARLHYLGNLKKQMFLLRGQVSPPSPGTAVRTKVDAQAVGEVVDSVAGSDGCVISAVLQLSHAASGDLSLDGQGEAALSVPQAYSYGP